MHAAAAGATWTEPRQRAVVALITSSVSSCLGAGGPLLFLSRLLARDFEMPRP